MPLMHAIVASSAAASGFGTKDASLLLSQGCRLGSIMGKVAGDNVPHLPPHAASSPRTLLLLQSYEEEE